MSASRLTVLWLLQGGCVVDYSVTGQIPDDVDVPSGDDAAPLEPTAPLDSDEAPAGDLDTGLVPLETDTADPAGDTGTVTPPIDTDDPPPADDCVATSDQIYLVDRNTASLHLYDPSTETTTTLGALDCDWIGKPESMAIARDGVGYVRWSDDHVYEVDLTTLDCTATTYQPGSFGAFGMGFATDAAGTWRDALYIANASTLAELDTSSWSRSVISSAATQVELTGTAGGELWAFAPLTNPARLLQIDKATGAVQQTVLLQGFPSAANLDTFAFAHWGGDFYLFVRTYGVGESSDVYRVTPQGVMTLEVERMGLDIVGAGSSTCAPTQ